MMAAAEGSQHFVWVQPSLIKRTFELRESDRRVARLEFEPMPLVSWELTNPKAARASAGEAEWRFTISRPGIGGFFGVSGVATVTGHTHAAIELTRGLSRGVLHVNGYRTYEWKGKLIRDATSTFSLPENASKPLVLFRTGSPTELITTRVQLTREGAQSVDWPLLVPLGFYLRMVIGRTWR